MRPIDPLDPDDPCSPESLLGRTGWLKSMAMGLVSDEDRADDIVQDTLLAAVEGPRPPRLSGGWLARVVRNLSYKSHRSEHRRRRRETRGARPEVVGTTPADLVERAEMQGRIAAAVVALAEPYRTTVLLRFFEDLPPREIARRQRVPVATVGTRLTRALAILRRSLDREYGERPAWRALLLPLAGGGAALAAGEAAAAPVLSAPAEAGSIGAAAGTGAAASTSKLTLLTLGGIAMTQKLIVAAVAAGAISLAVGFGLGRSAVPRGLSREEVAAGYVEKEAHAKLEERSRALEAEVALLKADREKAGRRAKELEAQAAALSRRLTEAEKEAGRAGAGGATGKKAPLAFGRWADLEGVRKADWKEMAESAGKIQEMMLGLIESQKKGEPIPVDFQKKVSEENNKLVRYAAGIMGKIPTHSPVNGEFTHPITLANLTSAMLDRAGVPLSAEQKSEAMRLGTEYETAYDEMQKGYDEGTPQIVKVVDELELKRNWSDGMNDILTEEQRGAVVPAELRGRAAVDLTSPATSTILIAQAEQGGSPEAVRKAVTKTVKEAYHLDPEKNERVQAVIDAWCRDLEPLAASPQAPGTPLALDQIVAAGKAQAAAVSDILKLPDLDENTRSLLLSGQGWVVPVTKKAGGKAEPAPGEKG